jgi:hypothetical protein
VARARTSDTTFEVLLQAIGLIAFAVAFVGFCDSMFLRLPRLVYFDPSFTLSLLRQQPTALAVALATLALVVWLWLPAHRGRLGWSGLDPVGGLRWVVFAVAMALAWNYAAHPYSYFFDRAHVADRWLLVVLAAATLRSPLLIAPFALELAVTRVQWSHPINSMTAITDQLPLRVLAVVLGGAAWNAGRSLAARAASAAPPRLRAGPWRLGPIRLRSVVFAALCIVGFYYVTAGLGKLALGEGPFDWIFETHLENLHVASHLNGWLASVSDERILGSAAILARIGPLVAAATLAIELGTVAILARPLGTLAILAALVSMHLGIFVTTGIFFWKWMVLEVALGAWLGWRRDAAEIRRAYSAPLFLGSLAVIATLVATVAHNQFAWWNTRWTMLYQTEVIDAEGRVWVFDYADLPTVEIFDLYKPDREPGWNTTAYGMTKNQDLARMLQAGDPRDLQAFAAESAEYADTELNHRKRGAFLGYMTTYFRNRNRAPGRTVPPFWISAPAKNVRHARGPDVYRDQAPVVAVRLRFLEVAYTGEGLRRMRDAIVYAAPVIPLPGPSAEDAALRP